jgi:hypothetical protein
VTFHWKARMQDPRTGHRWTVWITAQDRADAQREAAAIAAAQRAEVLWLRPFDPPHEL